MIRVRASVLSMVMTRESKAKVAVMTKVVAVVRIRLGSWL